MVKHFQIFLYLILSLSISSQTRIFPSEFEKQKGIVLTWDYTPQRDSVISNMAGAVQNFAEVYIIYNPLTQICDTSCIRTYLLSRGVGYSNISFIPAFSESLWIRHYGPLSGYRSNGDQMQHFFLDAQFSQYNRPNDDSIPLQLAHYWNIPVNPLALELEGSNIMLDGTGNGFGSKKIWQQNPTLSNSLIGSLLKNNLGLTEFYFIDILENSGGGIWMHVDMFMKIIDNQTILVSKIPEYLPDYYLLESIAYQLSQLQNQLGTNYQVIRIPAPPNENGLYATSLNDEMRTYTNSVIINGTVLVPSYNPAFDSMARRIYQENMPGYEVQMIDARTLTPSYGALHSISREITRDNFLRIKHKKIAGGQDYKPSIYIQCVVQGNIIADSQFVYYKKNNEADFSRIPMFSACPYTIGQINDLQPNDTVWYYISVKSETEEICEPSIGKPGSHKFWFQQNVLVDDFQNEPEFEIFPINGNHGIRIHTKNLQSPWNIEVVDLIGRPVFMGCFSTSSAEIPLQLARAWYIVKVYNSHNFVSRKFFIQ
ncbi:MAG: agmatine deiminase family protein [Bacteroidales bacterium]|nr:agmatine deiminase family protein [Bacteroidales bacterium]